MKKIESGNFRDVIEEREGRLWVMGHFMGKNSPFQTNNFELKWGLHQKGESKESPASNVTAKTLAILIRGKVSFAFSGREIVLEKEGDYVFWNKRVSHTWSVLEESLVLSIRWPSIPDDQKKA